MNKWWFHPLKASALRPDFKAVSTWDQENKQWLIPIEMVPGLKQPAPPGVAGLSHDLHEYQRKSIPRAVQAKRWIFGDEMGLGKTCQAISTLKALGVKDVLIVCPAIARQVWVAEFKRWWPEMDAIGIIRYGNNRKNLSKKADAELTFAHGAPVRIVSYDLIQHVEHVPGMALVIDELHEIKNPKAQQSQQVRAMADKCEIVLGITATLMPDNPADLWYQLDTIYPGRFSTQWKFMDRYMGKESSQYATSGYIFKGLNPLHQEELAQRLSQVCSRTTKSEIAHLLPTFSLSELAVERSYSYALPGVQDVLVDAHDDRFSDYATRRSPEIFEPTISWAASTLLSGATKVCILTHLKATASELCGMLKEDKRFKGVVIHEITGDIPIEQRHNLLSDASKSGVRTIVVATMHSIGISIDLTAFTHTLFAELYWRPATVIQALGRFSRLSGKLPSYCYLLVLQGTVDEQMAMALMSKVDAINKIAKPGFHDTKLLESLAGSEEDLALAAADYVEDVYG